MNKVWLGVWLAGSLLAQPAPVVVRAARMLDVASGEMVRDAVVVVEGGKITAVKPPSVPAGTKVIDLGDVTLLPGLTDVHTHLTADNEGDIVNQPVHETALDGVLRGVVNAKKTLLAGFTTVRDVGNAGEFADVALMHAIEKGWIPGPTIIPAGHALGITGGHCDATGFIPGVLQMTPEEGVADGVDAVIRAVRYQAKYGAKVIKICATAGVFSFDSTVGAQQYSYEEMRAIVEEARRHGLKVAAHAHGTEGIIAASKAGVASIEHGTILNEEAVRVLKQNGTFLVPNPFIFDHIDSSKLPPVIRAKEESLKPLEKRSLSLALAAGVKLAFGTDAAVIPHGMNGKQFYSLVTRGVKPLEAIRMATVDAAELIGLDDRGTIEKGKVADLIAVKGNPLEEIRVLERPVWVMKGGVVYQ